MARPESYKAEYAERAKKLCQLGATVVELADFFEVSQATIYNWQSRHPEFLEALKLGREAADERVTQSLYHKAIGYSHDAVKIFMPAGADAPVYAPYREQVAPDTTAAIFWLKNRRPAEWRDRHELTGADGAPMLVKTEIGLARWIADRLQQGEAKLIEGEAVEHQASDDAAKDD